MIRSGPREAHCGGDTYAAPLSNIVNQIKTTNTKTEKPSWGALVRPVGGGGGGGGGGPRDRLRADDGRAAVVVADIAKFGRRIDQLAGLCRLGASSTMSSCLAFWRSSGSLQRVRILQVASAFCSLPCPIHAVTISILILAPSA